jgi:hypothetical protein
MKRHQGSGESAGILKMESSADYTDYAGFHLGQMYPKAARNRIFT